MEVRTDSRELAWFGAERCIESEGEGSGNRHAIHAVGADPGQRVRLNVPARLPVNLQLYFLELAPVQIRLAWRKANLDQILKRYPPLRRVVIADLHAERVQRIHDHRELRAVQRVCDQRQGQGKP